MTYKDKVRHLMICLVVTYMLGPVCGLVVGATIELVQAEHGNATIREMLRRLCTMDTLWDVVADLFGVAIGMILLVVFTK